MFFRLIKNFLKRYSYIRRFYYRFKKKYLKIIDSLLFFFYKISSSGFKSIREDFIIRVHPTCYRISYKPFIIGNVKKELDNFIKYCHNGMVLLDVGAQFGIFSLTALNYGANKVLAFDPSPQCAKLMKTMRDINKIEKQKFIILRYAIGNYNGEMILKMDNLLGGYQCQHIKGNPIKVQVRTIDSIINEFDIMPTHIKIDVEGSELEVLQGAEKAIGTLKPIIFIEIDLEMLKSRGINPEILYQLLEKKNYKKIFEIEEKNILRQTWKCNDA